MMNDAVGKRIEKILTDIQSRKKWIMLVGMMFRAITAHTVESLRMSDILMTTTPIKSIE